MAFDSGDDMAEVKRVGGRTLRIEAEDIQSKNEAGSEQYVGSKLD